MASGNEEYKRLGRHIEGQFRLIIQVFTVSLVVSAPLLGYGLRVLSATNTDTNTISQAAPFLVLTPLAILIPSAYLIAFLRKEIFKWASYIKVYLEDDKELKYETELGKYRNRFPESESFNPIAFTYIILIVICALAFGYGLHVASMSFLWLFVLVAPLCFILHWCPNYYSIPKKCRQDYEDKWTRIKGGNPEAKSSVNADYQEVNTKLDQIQKSVTEIGQDLKTLASRPERGLFAAFYTSAGLALFTVGIGMIGLAIQQQTALWYHTLGWILIVVSGLFFIQRGLYDLIPETSAPSKFKTRVRPFLESWHIIPKNKYLRQILQNIDLIAGLIFLAAAVVLLLI